MSILVDMVVGVFSGILGTGSLLSSVGGWMCGASNEVAGLRFSRTVISMLPRRPWFSQLLLSRQSSLLRG